MPKQTLEEAAQMLLAIAKDQHYGSYLQEDGDGFLDGAKAGIQWQKEQYKDMIETLQELLRFEHSLSLGAERLQYPDNCIEAIASAKAALSKALD